MPAPQYHAFLFGPLRLKQEGTTLPLPTLETARSLLAYLLIEQKPYYARPALAGTLWPDLPETRARRLLTQALWQIRRILPELIQARAESIHINLEAVWVDVEVFRRQVALCLREAALPEAPGNAGTIQNMCEAIELYQGELLEGLYDDWVLLERERLRETLLKTLEALVRLEKQSGRFERALEFALRLTQTDHLHEAAHREVMRLQFALGRPEAALRQYNTCCQSLRSELNLLPEEETTLLAEEIRSRTYAQSVYLPSIPEPAHTKAVPLVGREQERAALLAPIDELSKSFGGVVLLEGEAGVGKSRLARQIAEDATWRGYLVLWGHNTEAQLKAPYASLVTALRNGLTPLRASQVMGVVDRMWSEVLSPLIPDLLATDPTPSIPPPLPPQQEHIRLVEAFSQCLTGWSRIVPLLIILEDIHWAGVDTLDLLVELTNRLRKSRVLILATLRGEEASTQPQIWEKVCALDSAGLRERLSLSSLSVSQTGELIQRFLGTKTAAPLFEERLFQETAGNPLFVIETLRSLQDEGLLQKERDGVWSTPWDETTHDYKEIPLPQAVERMISRRLKMLNSVEMAVLKIAAAMGGDLDFQLLSEAGEWESDSLFAAINGLVQRHFLEESTHSYLLSHDKVRQVTYAAMEPDERVNIHQRLAEALVKNHPDQIGAIAHHATQGQLWELAIQNHIRAGEQAEAAFAYQTALDHYTTALEILETINTESNEHDAALSNQCRLARANLAWIQGDIDLAQADLDTLHQQAHREAVSWVDILNQQSYFLCNALDAYDQAVQAAAEALSLAQRQHLLPKAAIALRNMGVAYHRSDHYQEAETALKQCIDIWQEIGADSPEAAEARIYLAQVYEQTGDVTEAESQGKMAVQIAQATNTPLTLARAYSLLARLAYRRADYASAIQQHLMSLEPIRQTGHKQNEAVELSNIGIAYWALRDYGKAVDYTHQGLDRYREIGNRRGMSLSLENLAGLYYETGRYPEALAFAEEGLAICREINYRYSEVFLLQALGNIYLARGEQKEAEEVAKEAQHIAGEIESPYASANAHLLLGDLCYLREAPTQAEKHYEKAVEDFTIAGETDFAVAARSFLALSRCQLGKVEDAAKLSEQAVRELEAAPGGEFVQHTYLHHWQILVAAGRETDAHQFLEKAYQTVQAQAQTLPDQQWQHAFLEDVTVHRNIVAAWQKTQPARITCQLPRADAPLGRPLRPEEWVTVTWTVSTPQDQAITGKVAQRQAQLLRLLKEAQAQGAAPTQEHLAQALQVGLRTIERDMAALARLYPNLPPTRRKLAG